MLLDTGRVQSLESESWRRGSFDDFRSYGADRHQRQSEIIQQLANPQRAESPIAEAIADAVARKLGIQSDTASPEL